MTVRPVRLLRGVLAALAATGALAGAADARTLRVTNTLDTGPGSLRAAITAANRGGAAEIVVELGEGAEILVPRALPALRAAGTRVSGGGVTLRQGRGCRRPSGQRGCDGLVVEAPRVVVTDVRPIGFTFDGVSVRGRRAKDVRLERIEAIDNLDDGIGVSAGAGPVVIEDALLLGNGFRTKGKGLLVFDDATATLRDSVVVANRDGVTVTRGSTATLERVLVVGNYDKGLGVSAAHVEGRALGILDNGYDPAAEAPSPNADGLRVGLGGTALLVDSRVHGNGDGGVVVLDTASVVLRGCSVEHNRGAAVTVAEAAKLERE